MTCDVTHSYPDLVDCANLTEAIGSMVIAMVAFFALVIVISTVLRLIWMAWHDYVRVDDMDRRVRKAVGEAIKDDWNFRCAVRSALSEPAPPPDKR